MESAPLESLAGIGDKRARLFHKLGLFSCVDLLHFYPRGYEDRSQMCAIAALPPGESGCIRATVCEPVRETYIRKGLTIAHTRVADDACVMLLTFFNAPYVKSALKEGETYIFYGKMVGTDRKPEMQNPVFEAEETAGRTTGCILPLYRGTAGLPPHLTRSAVRQVLARYGEQVQEALTTGLREEYDLCGIRFALENIHYPADWQALQKARRRLVFEELLVLSLGLRQLGRGNDGRTGRRLDKQDLTAFFGTLPFTLTGAQQGAIREVLADLRGGGVCRRLIQGDVGSGKTMVAAAAAVAAIQSGVQAALMAPTEILASQHARTLRPIMEVLGYKAELLTGRLTPSQKKKIRERLADGEIDLAIGTHALLSPEVQFKDLGLVITDEQHRFGVEQRATLAGKSAAQPGGCHTLIMSATPIPRTLALLVYGDLEVSLLRELPPGRQPVRTYVVRESVRARIWNFVRKTVEEGSQVYLVCPLIEENEEGQSGKAARFYYETLQRDVFPDLRIGLLHGRLKKDEKNKVMEQFVEGTVDILVATTVIEVGVDVPRATLMVIEDADRFGLSQLHQLRGRVGRGEKPSHCVLFLTTDSADAQKRLDVLSKVHDGFQIAEADLAMRGPGDFFGSRQHGLPELKVADLAMDTCVLQEAQQAAAVLGEHDPGLNKPEHAGLRARVEAMLERLAAAD